MIALVEHSIEESGEHRKFGCLPNAHSNSTCQLSAIASESFSKRVINVGNLLAGAHRTRLDHGSIGKMVVSRMSKRLKERARRKEALSSVMLHDVLSDEHASANEEWNY